MREVRRRVAHAQHGGHFASVVKLLQFSERRVEGEWVIPKYDRAPSGVLEFRVFEGEGGAQALAARVGVRDDGVQPVVAARLLNHHEDFSILISRLASRVGQKQLRHHKADRDRARASLDELSSIDWHCSPPNSTGTQADT